MYINALIRKICIRENTYRENCISQVLQQTMNVESEMSNVLELTTKQFIANQIFEMACFQRTTIINERLLLTKKNFKYKKGKFFAKTNHKQT